MDVSVVIPCYNAGPFLAQAVGSALDQTRPPREVIVVDDGSTDDSLAIARRFEARLPGVVHVLSQRSGSASATRNIGAGVATGDAIMFLDADDVIAPDALESLAAALERRPGAVAICPWYRLDLVEGIWVQGPASCKPREPGGDALAAWLTGWYHPPCSVMWTRDGFERAGRWDELCRQNDDGDLMMRALVWGVPLVEAHAGAGFYRRMPDAGTTLSGARFTTEGLEARIRVIRKVAALLADQDRADQYRAPLAAAFASIAADARQHDPSLHTVAEAEAARLVRSGWGRLGATSWGRSRLAQPPRRIGAWLGSPSVPARPSVPTAEVRFGEDRAASILCDAATPPATSAPARPDVAVPAVSVIVPTFNRAHLVSRAIGTVLAQTFDDFEVLVVDDGSTDDTEAVVEGLGDERVRYLRQERNQGVAAARNRGMRAARADLVAFLDSDDEWFPEKLGLQVERFRGLPVDVGLLHGGVEDDRGIGHRRIQVPTARGDVYRDLLVRNVIHGGGSSVMIRRNVIANAGFFDEAMPAMEDYDYWVRVARFFGVDFVDAPLVRYHDPRGGAVADRRSREARRNLQARDWLYRKYQGEMRRLGVRHRFLIHSAQRQLRAPDGVRRAQRLAVRAAWCAPSSTDVHRLLVRVFVTEPLRRSAVTRWVRRSLAGRPADPGKMRVFMYSSTSRRNAGGVQGVYQRLAAGLRRRGHTVVTAWAEPAPTVGAEQAHPESTAVYRIRLPRRGEGLVPLLSLVSSAWTLAHLGVGLRRFRPDLVNLHFVRAEGVLFLLLRRWLRFKLVLSVHGSDVLRPTAENAAQLPHLFRQADAITAVSRELADLVLEHEGVDPSKVHVISNGVDLPFWSATPKEASELRHPATILTVGRLTPGHKGQDVLLRALVHVRNHIPDARLVLIGDGQWRHELELLRDELALGTAASFVGELPPGDVREAMGRASVFALPSRREGMPLALLEAMCTGLPVVATAVGGVPDLVVPGTGLLVPAEDPVALADALVRVLSDDDLASELGAGSRRRAADFAASTVEARYEELFRGLLEGAGTETDG